jgi:ABC-type branched-subunit amino acid transport system ATPase component
VDVSERRAGTPADPASRRDLEAFRAGVVADELTLAVAADEILGVVGPNGAGKTSVFGLISGDLAPDSGRIELDGADIGRLDPARRCRLGIGRTYQVPRPFERMTVFENVLVAARSARRDSPRPPTVRPASSGSCSASGSRSHAPWQHGRASSSSTRSPRASRIPRSTS